MPPDEPPRSGNAGADDATRDATPDATRDPTRDLTRDAGESLPPLLPFYKPSPAERPLPRGCHPLVFGVVMATVQFAATCYFMPSCFGRPG